MQVNIYNGTQKENLIFSRDISRYSYKGDSIALTLSGGIMVEDIKSGQIVTVEIVDDVNGNINFKTYQNIFFSIY